LAVLGVLILAAWLLAAGLGWFAAGWTTVHPVLISAIIWAGFFALLHLDAVISPALRCSEAAGAAAALSLPSLIGVLRRQITRRMKGEG